MKRKAWIMNHFRMHDSRFMIHEKGFTMLELIISVGIFALITGTVLANFRGGQRVEELRNTTENVRSLLEQARTMTLTGQVRSYTVSGTTKSDFPAGGYGMAFLYDAALNATLYRMVAVDAAPGLPGYEQLFGELQGGERGTFPSALRITPRANAGDVFAMVTFAPPDGTMVFRGSDGIIIDRASTVGGQLVEVVHSESQKKKRVLMDRVSGRISVE